MPDWNPDKEHHRKHKWIVHNAQRKKVEGVMVDGKLLKFGKNGWLRLSDEGMANEVRQVYGRAVTVSRVNGDKPVDRGHTYFFNVPALPWQKYDELGRRIKETGDG